MESRANAVAMIVRIRVMASPYQSAERHPKMQSAPSQAIEARRH
jgi:hypothetical protein